MSIYGFAQCTKRWKKDVGCPAGGVQVIMSYPTWVLLTLEISLQPFTIDNNIDQ